MERVRCAVFGVLVCLSLAAAGCGGGSGSTPATTIISSSPEANAGPDQEVREYHIAFLDATESDIEGAESWTWTQLAGPTVELKSPNGSMASFRAPAGPATLAFQVEIGNGSTTFTDDVVVTVPDPNGTCYEHVASFPVDGGVEGTAEISCYDPLTKRLFIVNASGKSIDFFNLANPAVPVFQGSFALGLWFPGAAPNSVACRDGVLAIAWEAGDKQAPGYITVHYTDVVETDPAYSWSYATVGALPDMVTFAKPGGILKVLAAGEGEPNDDYTVDPEGTVAILTLDVSNALVARPLITNTTIVDFNAFDADKAALQAAGVRIFGPGASVSQDLEPEYIALNGDETEAIVGCQENNAVAVIDCVNEVAVDIAPLGRKNWAGDCLPRHCCVQPCIFPELPVIGTTVGGQDMRLGGFSGLHYCGTSNGLLEFVTIPDRGPQLGTQNVDADPETERPFALPDYQARIVHFTVNPTTCEIVVTNQTFLTRPDGTTPITGRSNLLATAKGLANYDEEPVDLLGNVLPLDAFGGDFEGIVKAPDDTFWMCDEYRPAIYHFAANGTLVDRFVPLGATGTGTEVFPEVYAQRRANRGFEAIAFDENAGRLYAFIQSPIDNPDTTNDANSKASRVIRILEFNPANSTVTGEFVYLLDCKANVDKIGGATWAGETGCFYVIERNSSTGSAAVKNIHKIDLTAATNLQGLNPGDYAAIAGVGGTLEGTPPAAFPNVMPGPVTIHPVKKCLWADLDQAGYTAFDKPEGLARLEDGRLCVVNDNDFGIAGASVDLGTGVLTFDPSVNTRIALAIVTCEDVVIDASNEDGPGGAPSINLRNWAIYGLYMPDAIVSFECEGRTFYLTANEGDARDYDGFSEEERVKDLLYDGALLSELGADMGDDENLGRLRVTALPAGVPGDGDTDEDGDLDEIVAYGARSFSIWDDRGRQVFDSGDQIERLTSIIAPTLFNSDDGDPGEFDQRSDDKGPEPEGAVIGVINGVPYGFIGLERFGGVLVYDLSAPNSPNFVCYLPPLGGVSPEGLTFVPADKSPTGKNVLIVTNEVSGTVTVFNLLFG